VNVPGQRRHGIYDAGREAIGGHRFPVRRSNAVSSPVVTRLARMTVSVTDTARQIRLAPFGQIARKMSPAASLRSNVPRSCMAPVPYRRFRPRRVSVRCSTPGCPTFYQQNSSMGFGRSGSGAGVALPRRSDRRCGIRMIDRRRTVEPLSTKMQAECRCGRG
jgi:hypothetical protein